ncbi:N,N-dimethylformamidase beta subunit family domain-containing protein [Noviherbaspirillum galbum]|uniref:N,N-dimethylformamidase beta subunit-like C-terminal domain-containing protein n=1 Tax=Noviherbaspirillum galbum TaxID=2709383 RepID=A0A6B3SRI2_9BURK|nr:N,N-dimethylformamidase beta subunit family domain-containing protein [Noviherbaspirillum galbum]NEX63304.1 hypothetical protein [Noviherbaspirillum galbum]
MIQRENAKTEQQGVTDTWFVTDADYANAGQIEGYASATSVGRGESIELFVNTSEPHYSMSIYRIGWYGGRGGRLVAGPIQRSGVRQPSPRTDAATRLVECHWIDPYVLTIPNNPTDPTDWASGVYLVKLTAGVSRKQSYIIFTVRDDLRQSPLLFQCSVTTYAAYNNWGGYDFYDIDSLNQRPAYKVSFNRPYRNPQRPLNGKGAGEFLTWEIMMVRFLEREGYDVKYCTNIDVDANPQMLTRQRAFLSVGHDEYWTREMRDAIEGARNAGVHYGVFSSNTGYWQVRLEGCSHGHPRRTVVCYKYDAPVSDPLYSTNPPLATGLWRHGYPGRPARPEAALLGVMYDYNSVDTDIVISNASHWICEGAGLANGTALRGLLGFEVDRVDPASSPANIQIIASSPYEVMRPGCTGPACRIETRHSNVTYYTAPSGSGVFASGSNQWCWGLDSFGEANGRVHPAVQRMTRNVLNRFISS